MIREITLSVIEEIKKKKLKRVNWNRKKSITKKIRKFIKVQFEVTKRTSQN